MTGTTDRTAITPSPTVGRRPATGTLLDLRVAEAVKHGIALDVRRMITYRTKLQLSFKYEPGHGSQVS